MKPEQTVISDHYRSQGEKWKTKQIWLFKKMSIVLRVLRKKERSRVVEISWRERITIFL